MKSEYELWKDETENGRKPPKVWVTIVIVGFSLGFWAGLAWAARQWFL